MKKLEAVAEKNSSGYRKNTTYKRLNIIYIPIYH